MQRRFLLPTNSRYSRTSRICDKSLANVDGGFLVNTMRKKRVYLNGYGWVNEDKLEDAIETKNKRSRWDSIKKACRRFVFERDDYKCVHCGTTENIQVDHIVPLSKGGENTYLNTQTLCRTCNCRKGAR